MVKLHGLIPREVDCTYYRIIDEIQPHHRLNRVTNEDLWKQASHVKRPFKYKSAEENGDGLVTR